MQRGRTPEWADEPFARWLRAELAELGENKKWLIGRLSEEMGKSSDAAAAQVNRWTYHGDPKTGRTLRPETVTALAAIFGSVPPGADPGAAMAETQYASAAEVAGLRERIEALEAERRHGANGRRHGQQKR